MDRTRCLLDAVIDDETRAAGLSGPAAFERWPAARRAVVVALERADPATTVAWAAAPLKPRTFATTRLAEHWAHGLDIVEPLDIEFSDTDRLIHVAWLGHASLPYAMRIVRASTATGLLRTDGAERTELDVRTARRGVDDHGLRQARSAGVGARRLPAAESGLITNGPHTVDALQHLRNYARINLPDNKAGYVCLSFDFDGPSLWMQRRMTTPTPVSRGEFGAVAVPRI